MKKISERSRKLIRKFLIFLGVSAISLIFQACYGPAPVYNPIEENEPRGQETEQTKQPVESEESKSEK